jgi:hypothetical protein
MALSKVQEDFFEVRCCFVIRVAAAASAVMLLYFACGFAGAGCTSVLYSCLLAATYGRAEHAIPKVLPRQVMTWQDFRKGVLSSLTHLCQQADMDSAELHAGVLR